MGKWSAFFVSLIPAALAGYLCFLLVTIGLPVVEEMGTLFWGPVGAGFLACVMCLLTPFGIAIFVKSSPKTVAASPARAKADDAADDDEFGTAGAPSLSGEEEEFAANDADDEGDLEAEDFESDDEFEFDSSSDFQSAELASEEFSDDEFDAFEDDAFDDDDDKRK